MKGAVAAAEAPEVPPEALSRYFRVLGDPTRLRIIVALVKGERTVSELVDLLHVPQSRVSNHLACLKWCGLAESGRQGRSVMYRVADPRVIGVLELAATLAEPSCEHLLSCKRIGPDWI